MGAAFIPPELMGPMGGLMQLTAAQKREVDDYEDPAMYA